MKHAIFDDLKIESQNILNKLVKKTESLLELNAKNLERIFPEILLNKQLFRYSIFHRVQTILEKNVAQID